MYIFYFKLQVLLLAGNYTYAPGMKHFSPSSDVQTKIQLWHLPHVQGEKAPEQGILLHNI